MGAAAQSVLLSTGTSSSSTLPPSNILWGTAAAALIGWATATALEEKEKRRKEEEQQRRQAEAEAARLNAAESARKAQEWQAGQNMLNALIEDAQAQGAGDIEIATLKETAATQGLGVAIEDAGNLNQSLQQAGLAAYYDARKQGEAESAQKEELAEQQKAAAAKVLAVPVKDDDPPKWWEKAVDWVDNNQVAVSVGIGVAIGLGALAIIATGGLATPLVIGGAAVIAAGLTAGGTAALNTYYDRPITQNLIRNAGTAATSAIVTAVAPGVFQAGQTVVSLAATNVSMYAYALGASWVGSATTFGAPVVGVGWSLWTLGSLGAIGYGASMASDPTLSQGERQDGAVIGTLGAQSLEAAVNLYQTADLINKTSAFSTPYGAIADIDPRPSRVDLNNPIQHHASDQLLPEDGLLISTDGSRFNPEDVVIGPRTNESKYLWVIDQDGNARIVWEGTYVPTERLNAVHSNLVGGGEARLAGEAWFVDENKVIINGDSGRYGPRSPVEMDAAANYWKAMGYEVESMGWNPARDRPMNEPYAPRLIDELPEFKLPEDVRNSIENLWDYNHSN